MRDQLIGKVAWITVRIENREGSESSRDTQRREKTAIVTLLQLCGMWDDARFERELAAARRRRGNRGHIRVEVITQPRRTTS